MSVPREPIPKKPPMPGPGSTPEPPILEPDPDWLPDDIPVPNPDENEEPPKHALGLTWLHKNIRRSSLTSSWRKSATVRTRTRSRALS